MRFTSLLVGVGDSYTGDNPPLAPPRRGGTVNERGGRSGRFVPRLFCPNLDQNPQFLKHYHLKPHTF
ncbi:MAG: hypothetical protein F6K48_23375 [Okeania sp. SIO3H1]|nr:hypothetical protein [Okeania sp. SIO3H1]